MKKIVIIGTSSSGKTTLGKYISNKMNIPHKELDEFYWEANWTGAEASVFRNRVDEFTKNETWVVDGNFGQIRDLLWKKANTIIWLDYPIHIILKQFLRRSIIRSIKKEKLWNNNTETFRNNIFSSNSLLIWIFKTYRSNKQEFAELMKSNKYSHLKFIRLEHPNETEQFLKTFVGLDVIPNILS